MKKSLFVLLWVNAMLAWPLSAASTAFTYQGRLSDGGSPANGAYDLQFSIYNAKTDGSAMAGALVHNGISVSNGLFTVLLDFPASVFSGADLWLELGVRTNGSAGGFAPLSPRQLVTSTPYATHAANFSGPVTDAQLPANIARVNQSQTFSGTVGFGGATTNGLAPVVIQGRGANSDWLRFAGSGGENRWHLTGANGGLNFAQTGVADYRLFLQTNGNVGIGTDVPSQRLHVNGGALIASNLTVGGALRSLASTHLFVPGVASVKMYASDTTAFFADSVGGVRIYRGNNAGTKEIQFPVTIPAVLHGQPATIQNVTIYYHCQNGANNFISQTRLMKGGDGGNAVIFDPTSRTNNVDTSYTLAANHLGALSSNQGFLGLVLTLSFANGTEWIQINGARITLAYQ